MKYKVLIVLILIIPFLSCKNSSTSPPDDIDDGLSGGFTLTADPDHHANFDTVPQVSTVKARVYDANGDGIEGLQVMFSSFDPVTFDAGMVKTDSDGVAENRVKIYSLLAGYCDVEIIAELSNAGYDGELPVYNNRTTLIEIEDCIPSGLLTITWKNAGGVEGGSVNEDETVTFTISNYDSGESGCIFSDVDWCFDYNGTDCDVALVPDSFSTDKIFANPGTYVVQACVNYTGTCTYPTRCSPVPVTIVVDDVP